MFLLHREFFNQIFHNTLGLSKFNCDEILINCKEFAIMGRSKSNASNKSEPSSVSSSVTSINSAMSSSKEVSNEVKLNEMMTELEKNIESVKVL